MAGGGFEMPKRPVVRCATMKKLADIEQPGKSAKDRSEFSKLMQVLVPGDPSW
jgi:hypothetical protein